MPHKPSGLVQLIVQARQALGWTQRELGESLGSSLRTAGRWETGRSAMGAPEIVKLARLVFPVRAEIAEGLAGMLGHTTVTLGVAPPPRPPPLPVAPAPPPPRPMAARDALDCIVCSVADASNAPPRAVRALVLLALRRAQELGVNLDDAAKAGALATEPAEGAGEPPAPPAR